MVRSTKKQQIKSKEEEKTEKDSKQEIPVQNDPLKFASPD